MVTTAFCFQSFLRDVAMWCPTLFSSLRQIFIALPLCNAPSQLSIGLLVVIGTCGIVAQRGEQLSSISTDSTSAVQSSPELGTEV